MCSVEAFSQKVQECDELSVLLIIELEALNVQVDFAALVVAMARHFFGISFNRWISSRIIMPET